MVFMAYVCENRRQKINSTLNHFKGNVLITIMKNVANCTYTLQCTLGKLNKNK